MAVCLIVIGELDLSNVAGFRTHLREAALNDSVVLNFSALTYLDSTAINVLTNAQQHLARDPRDACYHRRIPYGPAHPKCAGSRKNHPDVQDR